MGARLLKVTFETEPSPCDQQSIGDLPYEDVDESASHHTRLCQNGPEHMQLAAHTAQHRSIGWI